MWKVKTSKIHGTGVFATKQILKGRRIIEYIGEKVTMSEHMIQSAMIAERKKSSESLICACLLHDYGHFILEDPDNLVKKN